MPTQLFVYGTLMRDECRHRYLAGATFVGVARTQTLYRLYNAGDFPSLVSDSPGRSIAGELWLVSDDTLLVLDDVEGVAEGLYTRSAVRLLPPFDALAAETYIYLQDVAGLPEVGGSWGERRR